VSRSAFATIHLGALRHNLERVRALAPHSRVMAVVKADGYGHGLERVARTLSGADAYGVAAIADGLAQGLAVAFRRPAVDHHHAGVGNDKRRVDDIAAVVRGKIVGASLQHPGVRRDLPGLQVIVQLGVGQRRAAQG